MVLFGTLPKFDRGAALSVGKIEILSDNCQCGQLQTVLDYAEKASRRINAKH